MRRSRHGGHWLRVHPFLYLAAWRTLVGLLAVVGLVLAFVSVNPNALAAVAIYAGLIGLALPDFARRRAGPTQEDRARSDMPLRRGVRRRLGSAALAAVGVVAMSGLLGGLGPSALVLTALLAAGSPLVLARFRRAQQQPREDEAPLEAPPSAAPPARQVLPDTGGHAPSAMTFDELCRAWQASYFQLRQCDDLRSRARLVEARQGYLDELERRDPVAFALWLRSGARAVSNPSRYGAGRRP